MMHSKSTQKYSYFEELIRKESCSGFRTIGYSYREIPNDELPSCLQQTREECLNNLKLIGLLVFENKLKEDAVATIEHLNHANISPRIITGDNIYIAIETAMRCGILTRNQDVFVLEGCKQPPELNGVYQADILSFQNGDLDIRRMELT